MEKIRQRINALKEAIDLNEDRSAQAKCGQAEAKKRYETADIEITSSQRRFAILQAELARINKQVDEQSDKLHALTSKTAADDEVRVKLESQEVEGDERIVNYEEQAKIQKLLVENLEQQCDEQSRKVSQLKIQIEKADKRYSECTACITDLTDRLNQAEAECNDLKMRECTKSEKDIENEEKLRFLEEQAKVVGLRAENAERDEARLERLFQETEQEVKMWEEKTKVIMDELKNMQEYEDEE